MQLLMILLGITAVMAQPKTGKVDYYLIPQIALLNGDHSASGQVQFTGGIEKKGWGIGIGTAIDYYKVRTVPVFADLRACFGKNRSIFSYADLGCNMAWPLESQYTYRWPFQDSRQSRFSNGLYTDLGIGYSLFGKKNRGVVMSLGYSIKTNTETYYEAVYRDFPPYTFEYREKKFDYKLNRIVLRCGFRL
jgi:hypothetical protein